MRTIRTPTQMTVTRIAYQDWRNIEHCDIELSNGINVLWGMNAQGKSNILEGIYYFARGRSFRGAKEKELVRFGCDFAKAAIDFRRDDYRNDIRLEATLPLIGKKKLTRNGAPLSSSAEMIGSFCAVLFCPSNLSIVTGGPSERRSFLDIALSQLSGAYLSYLKKYTKYLAERNALLKRAADGENVSQNEWEVFAAGLAENGAWISAYRHDYSLLLAEAVSKYFAGMTNGVEVPSIRYTSHASNNEAIRPLSRPSSASPDSSVLFERLTSNIHREIAAGSTLWGIHKDDIELSLNDKETKLYGSQGQQRCTVLSLKLAEAEIAKNIRGEYPVILLDDVFSELDENRRRYILSSLGNEEDKRQIIITSCEPDVIPNSASSSKVIFKHVSNGMIDENRTSCQTPETNENDGECGGRLCL